MRELITLPTRLSHDDAAGGNAASMPRLRRRFSEIFIIMLYHAGAAAMKFK